ncbi:MAG: caspase family protein [Oculatellaceae cyanobacterium bins.114]|nr:caspase family protein [Oculatellaceae cyanobacterium bins.114]
MSKKNALLVGVSEYASGLTSLPGASRDVDAIQRILDDPEMGAFDQTKALKNPDRQTIEQAIEALFSELDRDDLGLLYFSGHSIKDDTGNLYLATPNTQKNTSGKLIITTAVAASAIHTIMNRSHSKRQVVILDCCFSGAFAEGMRAKDDGFFYFPLSSVLK